MDSCIVNIENDEIFDDFRYANYKTLIFKTFSCEISVKQDFRLGKGGILWDASYILAKFLTNFDLYGKNVLELGAATALPSLVAATLGAKVWASDIYPALKLTEASAELNNLILQGNLQVFELDWCEVSHRQRLSGVAFEYILLSDVFYLPVIEN
jgi:predicted nicotinamide N-methyase